MGFWANLTGGGAKVDTTAATLRPQGVNVIDVRSRQEFRSGHVSGARNLDVTAPDFATQVKRLNPARTYLVYCQSGGRSARAAGQLRAAGLTVLDGGGINSMVAKGWTLGA